MTVPSSPMATDRIRSAKHAVVDRVRAAGESGSDALVLDGVKLIRDSLAAGHQLREALIDTSFEQRPEADELLAAFYAADVAVYPCTDAVLKKVSALKAPQGVIAIAERPIPPALDELLASAGGMVVMATGVRDPGNLGAVIRSAEAAGAVGVVVVDSADPFRDKALRGSAGSALRVPILRFGALPEAVEWLRGLDESVKLVMADGDAEVVYTDFDWTGSVVLVVGSEGAGVPDDVAAGLDNRVAVPIAETVESLNVAVAASILLFEARRQRTAKERA